MITKESSKWIERYMNNRTLKHPQAYQRKDNEERHLPRNIRTTGLERILFIGCEAKKESCSRRADIGSYGRYAKGFKDKKDSEINRRTRCADNRKTPETPAKTYGWSFHDIPRQNRAVVALIH